MRRWTVVGAVAAVVGVPVAIVAWLWPQTSTGASSNQSSTPADSSTVQRAGPDGGAGFTPAPGPTSADNQAGIIPTTVPHTTPSIR